MVRRLCAKLRRIVFLEGGRTGQQSLLSGIASKLTLAGMVNAGGLYPPAITLPCTMTS